MFRILCSWIAIVAVALLTQPRFLAQSEQEPRTLEEWERTELRGLVEAVSAALEGELVQTDNPFQFRPSFLKGTENNTYIPFTLRLDPSKVNKPMVLMYLFVLPQDLPPADPEQENTDADPDAATRALFENATFEDAFFIDVPDGRTAGGEIELQRAFSAPGATTYDVYIAIRDSLGADADEDALAESIVMMVKEEVEVPDLWNAGLQTSTVIVAESVEPLAQSLTPDEQTANPFTLGTTKIVPKQDNDFATDGGLSLIMLVYNPTLGSDQMPDLTIDYDFHQSTDTGEEFFNRTNPQQFNAQTLPPGFAVAAGHQVVAGQSVPLASFPVGGYRLEIKVTDNVSGGSLVRELVFNVHE